MLVTGGASGIGAATTRRLAANGDVVVVLDIDEERAAKVAADVGGMAVAVDVADVSRLRVAITEITQACGAIDVVVNNAGGDRAAFFTDTDEASWRRAVDVNLIGVIATTHAVLPGMIARRRGVIVNVASEAGRTGVVAGAVYAAAKGGVLGFTKAIAREVAHLGIRCNAVAPGPIDTPLLSSVPEKVKQQMIDATVMKRLGDAEEVAAAIEYLASDDASFVTGDTISVSGGAVMV